MSIIAPVKETLSCKPRKRPNFALAKREPQLRFQQTPKTKKDQFVDLLRAKAGSDVKALSDALGWQPHTVRAALTGLRKAGVAVEKMPAREGELTRYRINAKRGRTAQ